MSRSRFWLCIQDKGCGQELIIMMTDVPPEPTVEPFTFEDWDKKCGLLSPHENWTLIATQTVLYVFCYSNVKVCLSTRMRL